MPETSQLQALMNRLGPRAEALLSSLEDALDRGGEEAVISLLSLASSGSHGEAPGGGAPRAEAERYRELAWLGRGGMGEVVRVSDGWMGRPVVRKVMLPGRDPARFLREARLTARLQHPGVPPVFEIGTLPDGRPCYTMAEVRGRTLATVIAEVHAASGGGRWGDTAQGMSLRRLIDAFHRVAEVVAYAHGQGVLHRDIKPQNVMLGDFGQVFLLDWGLARDLRSGAEPDAEVADPGAVGTRWGAVLGTPAYMAPEQAAGEGARVGPPADVYALGAVLYEILCGASPYPSNQVADVLLGPPPPVQLQAGALPLPDELTRLVEACLARRPEARPLSAAEVAAEVGAWLDGARRRDQALEAVRQADALVHEITRLRARADTLAAEAGEALRAIPTWAAEEIKAPHWAREDEAEGLRQDAEVLEIRRLQGLRSALNHVSDLPEAHERLAAHYQGQHASAEARRDPSAASRAELLLREHDRPGRFATYLKGTGAVTLLTDPPGAEVTLYRYETYNRRLVERLVGPLGRTPLREVSLERGSYLLILRKEGHQDVRYPVSIGRGEHWHGVPPDETEPMPIPLPREGELGPDDCYVPAGWFWAGGDYLTPDPVQLWRPWSDGLIVRRFPVTNNEFLMFLNSLVAMGLVGDADRWVPRERAGSTNQHGAILYHKDEYGRFFLGPDADGDVWMPLWPVSGIDWFGAVAYCDWYRRESMLPWRLLDEWEWEKSARGVDGRWFPWGNHFEPNWCCTRQSHEVRPTPVEVNTFDIDQSTYRVRGMGGNSQDWCLSKHEASPRTLAMRLKSASTTWEEAVHSVAAELNRGPSPPNEVYAKQMRSLRGGVWNSLARFARCGSRSGTLPTSRQVGVGLRLCRSFPAGSASVAQNL